jgi:hypothetical protein
MKLPTGRLVVELRAIVRRVRHPRYDATRPAYSSRSVGRAITQSCRPQPHLGEVIPRYWVANDAAQRAGGVAKRAGRVRGSRGKAVANDLVVDVRISTGAAGNRDVDDLGLRSTR